MSSSIEVRILLLICKIDKCNIVLQYQMILHLRPNSSLQDTARLYNSVINGHLLFPTAKLELFPPTLIVILIQGSIHAFLTWHVSFPALASDDLSMNFR